MYGLPNLVILEKNGVPLRAPAFCQVPLGAPSAPKFSHQPTQPGVGCHPAPPGATPDLVWIGVSATLRSSESDMECCTEASGEIGSKKRALVFKIVNN